MTRSAAVIAQWRGRHARTRGDRAYVAYIALMLVLVVAVPAARAVWVTVTHADVSAVLSSVSAPAATALIVTCSWAAALLAGRARGPALLPPFPTYTLATSDLSRFTAFGASVARAGLLVTTLWALGAALVGGALFQNGLVGPWQAVGFTASGALAGVGVTVAWLAGQAMPRAAVPFAFALTTVGILTVAVPALTPFTPAGWIALSYPSNGFAHAVSALTMLMAALLSLVPILMNRLSLSGLMSQAARWDSASMHVSGMDFDAAATVYRIPPSVGRHARAVRPGTLLPWVFVRRDAFGASRTPGRLLLGAAGIAAAAFVMTVAVQPGALGWAWGAAAGMLLFAGLGPVTDGIRHAVSVAGDLPMYGMSDLGLVAHHALFPVIVTGAVLLAGGLVAALILGVPLGMSTLASLWLGFLMVVARISNALKGALPPALLMPVPSPMGDLGAAVRLVWATDALLLAAFAGGSAALLLSSPALLVVATGLLLATTAIRWGRRS